MTDKEIQLRVDDINAQKDIKTKLEMMVDLFRDFNNYVNDNYSGKIHFKTKILQGLK